MPEEQRIKLASIYYYPLRDEVPYYVMEMADGVVGRDKFAEALRGMADNIDRTMADKGPWVEVDL